MYFLPLDNLIDELKQNGFIIGVDTYLRVQKLLENMDLQQHYHELNSILCPMFAVDDKQQQLFYEIYDRVFEQHQLTKIKPKVEEKAQEEKTKQANNNFFKPEFAKMATFFKIFAAAVLVIAMVWAGLEWSGFLEQKQEIVTQKEQQVQQEEKTITKNTEKKDSLKQKQQAQKEKIKEAEQKEPQITKQNQAKTLSEQTAQLKKELQQTIEQKQLLDSINREAETQKVKAEIVAEQQIREKQYNSKRNLAFMVLFSLLGLIVLLELYRFWRRRLIANKKQGKRPPFVWGIYIDDQMPEADKEIYKVANDLRIRKQSPLKKLDIKATINKTIDNTGLLEPQYLFQTKPVEYLVLIDWSSQKNHQAQLFEFLYKTFKSHNVYIERFFYNADPRILWNQYYNEGISLEKLQQRFPEHYLLVFGNGAAFIDTLNHTLNNFTARFREWKQRALLTPTPTAMWGKDELILSEMFPILLPSTSDGLVQLVEHFGLKSGTASDLRFWKYGKKSEWPVFVDAAQNVKLQLQQQGFSKPMLSWLAACALYPELYWDLTLMIGDEVADYYHSQSLNAKLQFNHQKQLSTLNRIDWFAEGQIPDSARIQLISDKEIMPDSLRDRILQSIINLLQQNLNQNQNDKNSFAYRNFLMNLVISKLLLKKSGENRAQLKQKLNELIAENEVQDYVALEYLEKQRPSPLALVLPRQMHKYFFNKGLSNLGLKKVARLGIYAATLLLPFLFLFPFAGIPDWLNIEMRAHGPAGENQLVELSNKNMYLIHESDTLKTTMNEYGQAFFRDIKAAENDTFTVLLADTIYQTIPEKAFYVVKKQSNYLWSDFNTVHRANKPDTIKRFEQTGIDHRLKTNYLGLYIPQAEEDLWKAAQNKENCEAYRKYLSGYPNGKYAIKAKAKINKLCKTSSFKSYTDTINGVPFEMVAIKGDSFTMGSPDGTNGTTKEPGRYDDEVQHEVTLADFYMGKYEVTQAEYKAIMGKNPSNFKGDNLPVEQVTWYDAVEFCNKLSQKVGLQPYYKIDKNTKGPNNKNEYDEINWTVTINKGAKGYRLPTEAEWEYAARAGTTTPFAFGDNITTDQVNYDGNYPYNGNPKGEYREKTVLVNSFKPNKWGLYNMHGNVYEWCWDWYGGYKKGETENPQGAKNGSFRVNCGGSWNCYASDSRSSVRNHYTPDYSSDDVGFRLAHSL